MQDLSEVLHLLTENGFLPVFRTVESLDHEVNSVVQATLQSHVNYLSVVLAGCVGTDCLDIHAILVGIEVRKLFVGHSCWIIMEAIFRCRIVLLKGRLKGKGSIGGIEMCKEGKREPRESGNCVD